METNDNDHGKGSNMETRWNEDQIAGSNEERKKEDQMKKNNRKIVNEDQMGGTSKKMKKNDPVEESNMLTNEENPEGRSNMKVNEDHPAIGKSVNIHDEDLKEMSSVGKQIQNHRVYDMFYAERLKDILKSTERIQQFKDDCYAQFTSSQREVFEEVLKAVKSGQGQCFFVEARCRRMKLDLLNAILAAVRIEEGNDSALATSSLQLSSHLLLGGGTFHYTFNASLNVTEDPNLQISERSILAEKIRQAKFIVVDEAVCLNKLHIEKLNVKLRKIADSEKVFGGKVIVLAGDFRQLLPVGNSDECELVINRSRLWPKFKVFTMRAQEEDSSDETPVQFDKWLQKLGNGDIPIVSTPDYIKLPEDMCMELQAQKREESLRGLIQFVFPSFDENIHDCAILALTKDFVQEINDACMESMPGKIETCLSDDKITDCTCESNPSGICPCSQEMLDRPPHRLDLKMGVPLILLATIQTKELVTGTHVTLRTGTRLTLEEIVEDHLKCTVAGSRVVNIPKIQLRPVISCDAPWDGRERFQFPVQVAFATTIRKSQGLMLKRVGVWLEEEEEEEDVFTHGQL